MYLQAATGWLLRMIPIAAAFQNKAIAGIRQFALPRGAWYRKMCCPAASCCFMAHSDDQSPSMRKLLLAFLLCMSLPSLALEFVPYHAERFGRLRAEGRPTAVLFHSGWCPICVMQERSITALKEDKALMDITVFQADFSKEENLRKDLQVASFSTLVVFRGDTERARATGDFRIEQVKALLAKAL